MNTFHPSPGEADEVPTYPEHFNPTPDSQGYVLFEHWEEPIPGSEEYNLLAVVSTPADLELDPGDWVLKRRWAPAAEPTIHNRARRQDRDHDHRPHRGDAP
jgi:hypothetical protein